MNDQAASLACITITYRPEIEILRRQLLGLPAEALKIVVDNASGETSRMALRQVAKEVHRCTLIELDSNLGLAGGVNRGAQEAAKQLPGSLLLLLDQDSEPEPGAVDRLMEAYLALSRDTSDLGCVGPRLVDASTGLDHGFHVSARMTWPRRYPTDGLPVELANINGSGTLVSSELFVRLGGLRTDFFIDHVDTEWAFRVSSEGYRLYGVPNATFLHRMGERGVAFWFFGWRVWPHRSPMRHYFLFCNTMLLLKSPHTPLRWKALAPVKLLATFLVHAIFDGERREQVRQMVRGGLAGARTASAAIS